MVAQCFQKLTLSKATTKSLLLLQTFQKRQLSRHLASLNTFSRLLDCLTFQRMMDRTLDGLEGMFPNMDDSRVRSRERETHLSHLEAFFAELATNGLAINLDKCVFAIATLEFLGHNISVA